MNTHLTLFEIATIVTSFLGFMYALIGPGNVPRQVWRGPIAAFGCGILSLGIAGTAKAFLDGLQANVDGSAATRQQVFDELLSVAWRPGAIAVIGLLAFVLAVRSTAMGDDDRAESYGGPLASLMVAGTAVAMALNAVYLFGFLTNDDPTQPTSVLFYTWMVSIVTVVVCGLGGAWSWYQGSAWNAEEA